MHMMRKITSGVLIGTLSFLSLTGCGKDDEENVNTETTAVETEQENSDNIETLQPEERISSPSDDRIDKQNYQQTEDFLEDNSFGGSGIAESNDEDSIRALLRHKMEKPKDININDPDIYAFAEYAIQDMNYGNVNSQVMDDIISGNLNLTDSQMSGVEKILRDNIYDNYYVRKNQTEAKVYLAQQLLSQNISKTRTAIDNINLTEKEIEKARITVKDNRSHVVFSEDEYGENYLDFIKINGMWFIDFTHPFEDLKRTYIEHTGG